MFERILFTFAIDHVEATRCEKVEAFRVDIVDEGSTGACEDNDASIGILTDLVEEFDELGVRVSVKDERITVGV